MADEADTPPTTAPRPAAPVVVARWVQLVMLPLGVLAMYALAHAAGTVLLLFVVAAVIALILNPLVSLVERAHLPRTLAVIAVYAVIFTALPFAGFLLSGPVGDQATTFANDVPGLVDDAGHSLDDVQRFFDDKGIDIQIKGQSASALASLQERVVAGSGEIVATTGALLRTLVELSFYVILVFVLSIYMLIYAPRIGALVRGVMPPGDGTPGDDFPTGVQRAVSGYVRAQLLFSLIMGASAGAALWILGVVGIFPDGRTYAFAFGLFFGLMELVPYVGPLLGALPPIIVALVQDPLTALWVALLFLAMQQLEGHVVVPNVFGRSLRLNPLLVILALLLGGELYGFVGAIVALPIAAIVRETVVYLRGHLVFEPWGTGQPILIGRPGAGAGAGIGVEAAGDEAGSGPGAIAQAREADPEAPPLAAGSVAGTEGPPLVAGSVADPEAPPLVAGPEAGAEAPPPAANPVASAEAPPLAAGPEGPSSPASETLPRAPAEAPPPAASSNPAPDPRSRPRAPDPLPPAHR
jgi:predicted PurR-regulated permease PerM